MNEFKKNIFKKTTGIETPPIIPTISVQGEEDINCYGQVSVRVGTSTPVKVNIYGNFSTGGSWLNILQLSLSGTKVDGDIIEDIVTFRKTYNFGIDGNKSGTITGSSSITLEIRDNTTNAIIDTYIFNRSHTSVQC